MLLTSLYFQWKVLRQNSLCVSPRFVESSWNVMAHGDAREGKWRGNWRMGWVASTLHTTSEHGVSSITTADAHTSAASSRLNWRPRRFKWTRPFLSPKDDIWFLRVYHHIANAVYVWILMTALDDCKCVSHSEPVFVFCAIAVFIRHGTCHNLTSDPQNNVTNVRVIQSLCQCWSFT